MDHIPAVASVMTPSPFSIDVADSLRRARGLMVEHGIRHLPVLHGQTLVGVLSDRDVKRALDPEVGLPPRDELFVRDAYVSEPYAVEASTALAPGRHLHRDGRVPNLLPASAETVSPAFWGRSGVIAREGICAGESLSHSAASV